MNKSLENFIRYGDDPSLRRFRRPEEDGRRPNDRKLEGPLK